MRARRGAWLATLLCLGCGASGPGAQTAEDEDEGPPPTYAIALRLEDAGPDENETPRTRASLVRIAPDGTRTVAALGEELGACYHQPAPGALIAARCWWGGAGARYVVRRVDDRVVALRADEDEMAGTAELEERGHVEVPEEARLEVLTPGGAAAPAPTEVPAGGGAGAPGAAGPSG